MLIVVFLWLTGALIKVVAGHDDDGTGELGDELEIENKKFEDEETL